MALSDSSVLLAEYDTMWIFWKNTSLAIGLAAGEQAGPIGMLIYEVNCVMKASKLELILSRLYGSY